MLFLIQWHERPKHRIGTRERDEKMTRGWDCKGEVVSFSAMAAVEFINVGLSTLYKAAAVKGLSYFVLIVYTNAIGALTLLPLIFVFPRYLLLMSNNTRRITFLFSICRLSHRAFFTFGWQNRTCFDFPLVHPLQICASCSIRVPKTN